MDLDKDQARNEIMNIIEGKDSFVFHECVTCYACEEYCSRENHPFYLITDRGEEKGILTTPRAITDEYINFGAPQGQYELGDIQPKILSFGLMAQLLELAKGELFEDVMPSYAYGPEFFCNLGYLHFGNPSLIRKRLPAVIDKFRELGVQEVICLHDECYGTFTSFASAYGIEVPFRPVHYFEYLLTRLEALKDKIRPLGLRVAYQRPCSSRLSPQKHPLLAEIINFLGAQLVERTYQDENSLCCGSVLGMNYGYELMNDVKQRNIDDMVAHGAQCCIFNCPACQTAMGEKVERSGLRALHIIELCRIAIGELPFEEGEVKK
jgi:Fe-S oxidoreductase